MSETTTKPAIDPERLATLRAVAEAATPGRRRWEVNRKHKTVRLMGGRPTFDLSILTFQRWGTQGATICFLQNPSYGLNNLITPAQDMATPYEGRDHHADWCADIDNPDARFIAAFDPSTALALLDRIEALVEEVADLRYYREGNHLL